ncbi:retinitis pigmentosa 1-like 1 protein [Heterodontus francisci]|uniref:retinitis pigmentosa 1-like 1 protein n=1 Tax=Heterodontus francisci TaxID=7792 RepID=UPI00355C0757
MNQASLGYSPAIYPFNFKKPLPSATKVTNLTEVTPAKKITFYKSGDPQLTGVKMTVNKRTFKTFDALLDDLTQKASLPFAVRTVTTPHGVHNINSLEQLEDGGSYICSNKKHVKPINMNIAGRKPATWQDNNPMSASRHTTQRARQEESHMHHTHMAHKKIILIKNGNVDIHYSIVLHKRNTHSFRSFLDEISELMQYSVRKLYTVDGRNIDTLQALFHCPSVLVCAGHEAFKPIVNEKFRRRLSEKLPDLSRRSRANVNNVSVDMKKNGQEEQKCSDRVTRGSLWLLSATTGTPIFSPLPTVVDSWKVNFLIHNSSISLFISSEHDTPNSDPQCPHTNPPHSPNCGLVPSASTDYEGPSNGSADLAFCCVSAFLPSGQAINLVSGHLQQIIYIGPGPGRNPSGDLPNYANPRKYTNVSQEVTELVENLHFVGSHMKNDHLDKVQLMSSPVHSQLNMQKGHLPPPQLPLFKGPANLQTKLLKLKSNQPEWIFDIMIESVLLLPAHTQHTHASALPSMGNQKDHARSPMAAPFCCLFNFGLEAKKSVIHPRSPSRSSRFSLSPDKSYTNGLNMPSSNSGCASFLDSLPHTTNGEFIDSMIDDDIEKKVHVNKDGSLSVEMKVRFRLLNCETLQWSTQIRRSSLTWKTNNEHLCSVEDCATEQVEQRNTDNCFDGSFYSCDTDGFYVSKLNGAEPGENCCKHGQEYDIWKNPMFADKITQASSRNGRQTHSSLSSASPCQGVVYQRKSVESIQTTTSEEYSQHFVQQMENRSETVENEDGEVEYSVSHCRSLSSSCTSAKTGGYHKSRTSVSGSHSAISHSISSHSSTNISRQNSNDGHLSCVSPSNFTASSERKVAVKTMDITENVRPATLCTNLEVSVDLKEVDSTEAAYKPVSNISESFHCLKCNKQIKGEGSSEGKAQNVSSSSSKHSIDGGEESVALNHLRSSTTSSCSNQFGGKTNAIRNVGYAEDGNAYSVVASCSLHNDNNPNREIYEENRPGSDVSLSSGKCKTDSHIKQNLNKSERQSSPEVQGINHELHFQDNDTNGRPVSNTTCPSSRKSHKCTTNMDADDNCTHSVLSWSSTSSAAQKIPPSLTADKEGNASCSENFSEKNRVKPRYQPATFIHSEQSSLSEHAKIIVSNTTDKNQRDSNSELLNCSSSSSTSRCKIVKSEGECRPSSSVSGNSEPNLKAGDEGKTSNEDKTPTLQTSGFSEVLQIETHIKMEHERRETAQSICSTVSKASRDKSEAESQEQKQVEDELGQTNISKLSNVVEVELLSCKVDEDTITQTNSVRKSASVPSMPQSFAQRGKAGGKNTRQLLMDPGLKSKSSISTDNVAGKKTPACRPTTSASNLSKESTIDKPHKENVNKSDSDKNSENVSSKEKCKASNKSKRNKNKKSTYTGAVACGKNDLIPGVLPNASFEEIVHEWLKKIPSENMLMKYDSTEEFQDKCEKYATDVMPEGGQSEAELTTKLEKKTYEEESNVSNQESKEKNDSKVVMLENSGSPIAEDKSAGQDVVKEVDVLQSKPISSFCSVLPTNNELHEKVLPNNVLSSVHIIKVLLSSKQRVKLDRSNSLPSLNLTLERKLSHSAKALLTCLASLQFFDKESSDSENKSSNKNNSAQKELLSTLKSLWFTDIVKEDDGEISQTARKHSKTFKGHNSADDNVTPLSSSGVDVNSGSGGSGDGSMGGTTDVLLATERKKCNLDLKTCMNKKDNTSKQNQPSLMNNSFDENSDIFIKLNEKNKEYPISSAESIVTNASCRKLNLRNCRNAKNKSEDNDNFEKRSLSRNSEISRSDIAPSSPVTPDIAYRVQWSSGEQSNNDEDLDENVNNNTGKSPQDTNQNIKEQAAPKIEGMKPSTGNSCDMEEIVYQTKAKDHNEAVDVDYSEEEKIVLNKITEKYDNAGIIKTPQQITSDHHCPAQAVIADQEPEPTLRKSLNADPAWLLKLLKKMEMQFITHYVDAMNEFKIKWNLEADDRLEQMIEDLREDVSRRIQGSIERELKKVQYRAGRKKPSPPSEPRSQSSEQTEQRRKRLKAIYKMQTFSPQFDEPNHEHSTKDISSPISDEELIFSEMLGDNVDPREQFILDKFCPCDSCTEKSKAPKLATNAMQRNIPIVKDFDLREILRVKINNEQIKKHVTGIDETKELLDWKINKYDCGESESMELVQNKIEQVSQYDESVNQDQENGNVNNECQNHKLNRMLDQDKENVPTGNHTVGLNLEDTDEKKKQVDKCKDDLDAKSEKGGESLNISDDTLEPNEDKENDVYKDENKHKNDKEDSKHIKCETDNTKHNNEVVSTATEEYKEQNEENNVLCNNTDSETQNKSKLEELHSVDSPQEYNMSENNIRYTVENNIRELHDAKNLDNDVSELSDENVKSNAIKSQKEEVVEVKNSKLTPERTDSLDVISCPQHSGEGIPDDSAKMDTDGDNVQICTKEATSSSSNSPGNKSFQMYPESSSDEDISICTSPEAREDQKEAGNNSDPDADQKASLRNKSKIPGNRSHWNKGLKQECVQPTQEECSSQEAPTLLGEAAVFMPPGIQSC